MHTTFRSNVSAPTHWDAPQTRACTICDHRVGGGERCKHPQCYSDVNASRAPGGPCGPEAKFLSFPGWRP